jgi:chromate transporter
MTEPRTTWGLVRYFLYLGSLGFGGPVALIGYMQRDLVERRQWFDPEDYMKGLALSQLAPGPLAAQLAMCLGYAHGRVTGTEPDVAIAPGVVRTLLAEGLDLSDQQPRKVTSADTAAASRIVAFGCDLGDVAAPGVAVEQWTDVPRSATTCPRFEPSSDNISSGCWTNAPPEDRADEMGDPSQGPRRSYRLPLADPTLRRPGGRVLVRFRGPGDGHRTV